MPVRVFDAFLLLTMVVAPWLLLALALAPFRDILRRDRRFLLFLGVSGALLLLVLFSPLTETLQQAVLHATAKPWLATYVDEVRALRAPLWITEIGTGLPALAHPWVAFFSPFTALLLFFRDLDHGVNIILLVHLVFAALSLALGIRALALPKTAAALAALAIIWNPWVFRRLGTEVHALYLFGFAWLPLAWALTLRALKTRAMRDGARVGIPLAFMAVSMPTLFAHTVTAIGILFLTGGAYQLVRRRLRPCRQLVFAGAAVVIASALAAAPEHLAAVELLRANEGTRLGTGRIYGWRDRDLSARDFVRLLFPNEIGRSLTGLPSPPAYFGVPFSPGDAVVVVALVGFAAALLRPSWRARLFPVRHALLCLLLVGAMTHGPLYEPFLRFNPLTAAAGTFPGAPMILLEVVVLFFALGGASVAMGLRKLRDRLVPRGVVPAVWRRIFLTSLARGAPPFLMGALVLLLVLELLWGLRAVAGNLAQGHPPWTTDLRFSVGRLPLAEFARLPHLAALGALTKDAPFPPRIFCVGDVGKWPSPCFEHALRRFRLELLGVGELAWSLPRWQWRPLTALWRDWDGTFSPVHRRLLQLASVQYVVSTRSLPLREEAAVRWDPAPGSSKLYGAFAEKTLGGGAWGDAWDQTIRLHTFPGFPRVFFADAVRFEGPEEEQAVIVQQLLERESFHPRKIVLLHGGGTARAPAAPSAVPGFRTTAAASPSREAFFARHPARARPVENVKVLVQSPRPGAWVAEATAPRPGVLFFSQLFYPGFRATVNGRAVPVERAHLFFTAVPVPAGPLTVSLTYAPVHLYAAALFPWLLALALRRRAPRGAVRPP